MGFIVDTLTIAGVISIACTIFAVLIVHDCCKIRHNLRHKFKNK